MPAAALVALLAAGCVRHAPPAPAPLAAVSPLPVPSLGPPVAAVAPTGEVGTLAQVRLRFADDLIPLERLESPDEAAVLAHFALEPALPGRFRFLTPRMIGFEAERAWPASARVRVTIAKGLRDVRGRALADDLAWTFQTPRVALGGLPGKDDTAPRELRPRLTLSANLALDRASLEAHARVRVHGEPGEGIALVVPPDTPASSAPTPAGSPTAEPSPDPATAFDPSQRDHHYVLVPAAELAKGKRYDVTIAPGVLPRDGNLPSDQTFSGSSAPTARCGSPGSSAARRASASRTATRAWRSRPRSTRSRSARWRCTRPRRAARPSSPPGTPRSASTPRCSRPTPTTRSPSAPICATRSASGSAARRPRRSAPATCSPTSGRPAAPASSRPRATCA